MNTADQTLTFRTLWLSHTDGRKIRMDRAKSIVRLVIDASLNGDPDLPSIAAALEQAEELIGLAEVDSVALEKMLWERLA